jgi:carbamoyl-phosphate synthase large subunit
MQKPSKSSGSGGRLDGRGLTGRTVTVLVTGVGAPGTKGTFYCLRNNDDGVSVRLVGTDIEANPVGKTWVQSFHRLPPPEAESYIGVLNEVCSREGVDVVLPQTTRETIVLSSEKSKVKTRVAVSGASAVRKANNKFLLLRVFEKLGFPRPDFELADTPARLGRAARRLGYPEKPVVIKPPVSFGSRGFRVLRDRSVWNARRFLSEKPSGAEATLEGVVDALRGAGKGFPSLLVTEYLPGDEYSVDAFRGEFVSVAVPRIRNRVVNGISFETTVEPRRDMIEYTLKASSYLRLRYAFGFQYKLDSGGTPRVLECNPRVQGTMVASYFGGVNVIWMAIREALGVPPETTPKISSKSVFRRYWGGVGYSHGAPVGEI